MTLLPRFCTGVPLPALTARRLSSLPRSPRASLLPSFSSSSSSSTSSSSSSLPRPRLSPRPNYCQRQQWLLVTRRSFVVDKMFKPIPKNESRKKTGITLHYEDLPSDYRDADGLSFSNHQLTPKDIDAVFGHDVAHQDGIALLNIMHGRRVAGTLDDPVFWANTAQYGDDAIEAALRYLRANVPVNEVLNAGLRAQDELDEMDRQSQRKAAAEGKAPVVPDPDPIYGYNTLDATRARNRQKAELEHKRFMDERESKGLGPVLGPLELLRQPREMSPRMRQWHALATTDIRDPPDMSHWARLGPGLGLFVVLVGGLAAAALVYEPPPDSFRLFPMVTPAHATVGAVVLANSLVWIAWKIPPAWPVLNRWFYLIHGMPKAASLVLSIFSHQKLSHLLVNMSFVCYFGSLVHDEIGGRAAFTALYVGSGMAGMLGSMAYLTTRGVLGAASLGASGSGYGLMGAYFWLHATDYFKVAGIPPDPVNGVPGIVFLSVLAGLNFGGITALAEGRVDIFSHLVGMLFGVGFVEYVTRRLAALQAADLGPEETRRRKEDSEARRRQWVEWNVVDLWTGRTTAKQELRIKAQPEKEDAETKRKAAELAETPPVARPD